MVGLRVTHLHLLPEDINEMSIGYSNFPDLHIYNLAATSPRDPMPNTG